MAALSEEVARAVSLHYKENSSVFPRCLCFPQMALFFWDWWWGWFLLWSTVGRFSFGLVFYSGAFGVSFCSVLDQLASQYREGHNSLGPRELPAKRRSVPVGRIRVHMHNDALLKMVRQHSRRTTTSIKSPLLVVHLRYANWGHHHRGKTRCACQATALDV